MNKELQSRWTEDPVFVELLQNGVLQKNLPMGMDRKLWFRDFAPLIRPYIPEITTKSLDCRNIDLSNMIIGKQSLNYILDFGIIENSIIIETALQDATAQNTNFKGTKFIHAHMTPFYAKGASFKDCVFMGCYFTGIMATPAREESQSKFNGIPTDLTNCIFVRTVGSKTDFDRCDFRNSDFTEAYFEDCRFDETDLRNVNFRSTRFANCNFANAWLSDTPENRAIVACGENKNIEQIHWKSVSRYLKDPNRPLKKS